MVLVYRTDKIVQITKLKVSWHTSGGCCHNNIAHSQCKRREDWLLMLLWLGDNISNQLAIHLTLQRCVRYCYGNPSLLVCQLTTVVVSLSAPSNLAYIPKLLTLWLQKCDFASQTRGIIDWPTFRNPKAFLCKAVL